MSVSTTQGSPDWSRQAPWSDQLYINDQAVTIASQKTFTPFFVANIRAVRVNFTPSSAAGRVFVNWYADQSLVNLFAKEILETGSGQPISRSYRPQGAWCQVQVLGPGTGALTYTLQVQSVAEVDIPGSSRGDFILLSKTNGTVNAGATATDQLLGSHVGWAMWQCFTSGTNWSGQLISKDINGNSAVLAERFSGNLNIPTLVILPGGDLSVNINNADAAGHGYTQIVVAYPAWHL